MAKTQDAAESAPGRIPLTPADWIQAALELLVDGGVDLVRVDVVAKRMGVTRGSFYHHFRDRKDLLQRLLQAWLDSATEQVTVRFGDAHAEPQALLHELMSLPFRGRAAQRAARIELAIRDWARRDPMAQHALDAADSTRISYIAQVFSAIGFSIPQARSRAAIFYAYEVGESLLVRQGTAAQKTERSALLESLLLQR